MIKGIFFDLDGVLYPAVHLHAQAFNNALQTVCGFKLSEEEHWAIFNGLPTKKKIAILSEHGRIHLDQFEAISRAKQQHTIKLIKNKTKFTYGDKTDMLKFLKRLGIKTACVTNSITQTAVKMLSTSGQLEYLDLLISNQEVNKPKPDPEGYLKAIDHFGFSPEECVIVEDSPYGIQAARASKANVIEVKDATEVNYELINRYLSERFNLFKQYPILKDK